MATTLERIDARLLAYCLMPNHWHLVLWPRENGDLSTSVALLSQAHTQRWRAFRGSVGEGHLYQDRFKSFPVQTDDHFLTVCRYVERNALRAGLVRRADEWRWGSLWRRQQGEVSGPPYLSEWPGPIPAGWIDAVNEPQTAAELEAVRGSVQLGTPFGDSEWQRVHGQKGSGP